MLKETNMVVAGMMICKFCLIWRHTKTLYWHTEQIVWTQFFCLRSHFQIMTLVILCKARLHMQQTAQLPEDSMLVRHLHRELHIWWIHCDSMVGGHHHPLSKKTKNIKGKAVRRVVLSGHKVFGDVTNKITNFKSPIFLFQVTKLYSII